MPIAIKNGVDGGDYESCLTSLKDKGDARYGICMKAYEQHHMKNDKGQWIRKQGHAKNNKGEWIVAKNNKNFAGFDDYIPIFRGGKQIDNQGTEHNGDAIIDKAVQLFDAEYHEAPITVGHPKDDSPAFGWVEGLKTVVQKLKDGTRVNVLMAKFKDVVPEFAQAVKQGLYKKRSASFYPDGRLRHVGFLGGIPPAVKGLADLKFEDFDEPAIIFGEQEIEQVEIKNSIHDFWEAAKALLIKTFGEKETNEALGLTKAKQQTAGKPLSFKEGTMPDADVIYTEAQLQARLKTEQNRLTAEFAEGQRKAEEASKAAAKSAAEMTQKVEVAKAEGKAEAEATFAENQKQEREKIHKIEIKSFISQALQDGKILPAWEKMGLAQFMENLGTENSIDFAEGKKETTYDFFKRFLTELPKTIDFGEFATRVKNVGDIGNAGEQLSKLIVAKMEKDPKKEYMVAFNEVQREHRELALEYQKTLS